MAYDPNHIAYDHTDTVSVVRFLIADTEADELSDAEITALATQYRDSFSQASKNIRTAIDCAEHLHTKYLKQATFSSAGTSVNLRERAEQWGNAVARLSQRRDALEGTTDTTFVYRPRSW